MTTADLARVERDVTTLAAICEGPLFGVALDLLRERHVGEWAPEVTP